ncbi:alpha/beta fold hydrolase [Thalassotalea atypica]|uniref:alpha/beta fold hydrolase n=1 Tax=Thalassotalea atypica TaxID=2054316 RepID=UPI00257333FA|nr:alpha/beta fold hydrolase [Thalassotalea atypica]
MRTLMTTICLLLISWQGLAKESKLELEECHVKGIKEQVQCGTLTVPEDYQKPEGTSLDVNVVVLPAIDRSSELEPLMFLAGGPGQAATELSAHIRRTFYEIRKTRDIILVDQRGTGKSNAIICDEAEFYDQNVYTSSSSDFSADDIRECIGQLKQNLSQYNSENAIRDFDAVRAALGHQKINIYGGSYGTRAALVYMRLLPDSLRSVVLDSVGPIEVPIGPFGQSSARSFSLLVENCNLEAACAKAFPDLESEFQTVYERLMKSPEIIRISHPRLGTPLDFKVDGEKFISVIFTKLYSMELRTVVPLTIHQAFLGNFQPLAGLLSTDDTNTDEGGMYFGLTLNIVCNEDFPLLNENDWNADADNTFGRNVSHRVWRLACPLWPKYRPSSEFYQPVTADIPTLVLSGNLDPVTPPSNGEKSDATLVNSHHIVVKNAAHIVASSDCGVDVVNQFLTELKPDQLDEKCLTEIPDESFMTSLNGNI